LQNILKQHFFTYILSVTVLFTVGMDYNTIINNYSDTPSNSSMKINSKEQITDFHKLPLTQPYTENNTYVPFMSKAVEAQVPIPIPIHNYEVTSYYLNVRANMNATAKILNVVKYGDVLEVLETTDNNWLKLKSGGYVNGKYAELISKKDKQYELVSILSHENTTVQQVPSEPTSTVKSDSKLTEEHIAQIFEGSSLADNGLEKTILEIEQEYGINSYFTIAVMKIESGHGKSKIAKEKNNLFGLNAIDSDAYNKAYSFKTKGESVRKFGQLISKYYVDKGYTSVEKVANKYCQANPKWSALVMSIMKSDYKKLQ
jgi:flagellum-specific peptidoglycan hydrolase FlgJ